MSGGQGQVRTTNQGAGTEPGSYGRTGDDFYGDSRRLSGMMEELMKKPLYWENLLKGEMTSPQYGATTASEKNLLESLTSQTHGAATLRGLGSATPSTLANVLAPTLIDLREKRFGNLMKAAMGEGQMRGVDYASLLDLIRQATPRTQATGQDVRRNTAGFMGGVS